MTLRSASYSLKYTENTPITAIRKVYMLVRRQCLSWSIERGNLWKKSLELLRSKKALVHRLGLCSMNKDERSSQNVARKFLITNFRAARAEPERKILQEELWRQQKDFREVHQQNLTEMEELRKFQSSTFDTLTRQKFIEDQNNIMELSRRLQELQNEVNCMSDSEDFQDAESVRSGNSHVTSQPMLFPKHPAFEGMLRPSFVSPRRKDGPPNIWDTPGISGNVFANPQASSSALHPQELNSPWKKTVEEPLHMSTAEKSDRPERNQDLRCQSGPSAKDSVIFSGGDYSKNMGQTNSDCRFRISILTSSLRQQPLLAGR